MQAAGAAAGGLLGGTANQKEGGKDAGNLFALGDGQRQGLQNNQINAINHQLGYAGDPSKDLQSDGILGQTYGQGGTYDRTSQEEQGLANRGFSLKPEDYEAYGQGSGNIARMFGQNDQSMAQALSDRGLSNSGAAGAAFTGAQGNKQEQLAGLQMKIANDRMNMNLQRLGQTRNFLSQLGQQANTDMNSMEQRGIAKADDLNQASMNKFNMSRSMLGDAQGQANEGLQQQQQTQHASNFSNILNGMSQGAMATSGMSGGGAQKPGGTQMAGQSTSNSMFA